MKQNQNTAGCLIGCTGLTITATFAGIIALFTDSFLLGCVVLVIGVVVSCGLMKPKTTVDESELAPPITSSPAANRKRKGKIEFETRIAGAPHHCNDSDIGGFLGYIQTEPSNPYDKNAIGVYRNDGKLLGYIPKNETTQVKRWASQDSLPCIGYIMTGDMVDYWGKITIIDADPHRTELELVRIALYMVHRDGIDILPPEFRIEGEEQPSTKKEWVAVLEERIKELESTQPNQPTSQS